MSTWRQILSWEIEPSFQKGDIVRLRNPNLAAPIGIDPQWAHGTFEVIRSSYYNPYTNSRMPEGEKMFWHEVAIVPRGWSGPEEDVPPVFVVGYHSQHALEFVKHISTASQWEIMADTPDVGDEIKFIRTEQLRDIGIDWGHVEGEIFLVREVDPDDMGWGELGQGSVGVWHPHTSASYSIPLEHWSNYIKVVG